MKRITTEDCVRIEKDLFFIDSECNIIYKMGIENGIISIIGSIPEENLLMPRLGAKIVYLDNKLFFSPMNAKKIWRYDLATREWKGFARKVYGALNCGHMFQAVEHDKKIFFLGSSYPAIIVLDTITERIEYIEKPYEYLNEKAQEENDSYFRTDYVKIDNKIYMASCVSNEIFVFDLDTYKFEFVAIGEKNYRYSGIMYDGNKYYLSPRKNTPIVTWDGKNTEYYTLPQMFLDKNEMIFGGVCCDKDIIVFPSVFWNKSIVIDDKNDISSLKIIDESYYFYKTIDNKTLINLKRPNMMTIKFEGKEYKYTLEIDEKTVYKYLKSCKERVSGDYIVNENKNVDIKMFINAIL